MMQRVFPLVIGACSANRYFGEDFSRPLPPANEPRCLGEFGMCSTGECSMGPCGKCKAGQYLCPSDQTTCVEGAEGYFNCPNIKGTHFDWTMDTEERLQYLVDHTTVEEQAAQLSNTAPDIERMGIPAYQWLNDDQHGVARTTVEATVFPNGCGMGATWAPQLIHLVGNALGEEARGLHNSFVSTGDRTPDCNGCGITLYSPNLNLVRDPRWGRAQETFGEDAFHMASLVDSYVRGAQNTTSGNKYGPDGEHINVGMCCKHAAAYSVETTPTDRYNFNALVNARNLWENYLPAFHACLGTGKATHVMCSYNEINGVPTCAEPGLLNDVFRGQWGFDGFVVSDYDAWAFMKDRSQYASSYADAAVKGLQGGLDQEGGGNVVISTLPALVQNKTISAKLVQTAFQRLFRIRIRLGMLDPPTRVQYNYLNRSSVYSAAHQALAVRIARASMTLLKNSNKALPLRLPTASTSAPFTIALVGPQVNLTGILMGNYANSAVRDGWGRTILQQLQQAVQGAKGAVRVVYAQGCLGVECNSTAGFAQAVEAVKQADAIVVTLGLQFDDYCKTDQYGNKDAACEQEMWDRHAIELPGNQSALVSALAAATPPSAPLIGLLVHGGALALGDAEAKLDAVLSAWYPGIGGSQAIVDVLLGNYNPAGRSAVTWYQSTDQLPPPGTMDMYAGDGLTYKHFKGDVLYPFGYGLSYTKFSYSKLSLNASSVGACDTFSITVTISNTGGVDGDEVVQVYATQHPDGALASVPRPRVQLVSFARVFIPANTERRVVLEVAPKAHFIVSDEATTGKAVYDAKQVVAAGTLQLFVGGGQPGFFSGGLTANVTVSSTANLDTC